MATGWTVNGVDLRSLAINIEDVSGWSGLPARATKLRRVPYVNGEHVPGTGLDFRKSAKRALKLLVLPRSPSGAITLPGGALEHAQANEDTILREFGRPGTVNLTKTMIDGTVRREDVVVLDAVALQSRLKSDLLRGYVMPYILPRGTWAHSPVLQHVEAVTASPQAFSVNPAGSAWTQDMTVTMAAGAAAVTNPRITNTDFGYFLQYSGTINPGDTVTWDITRRVMSQTVIGTADILITKNWAGWFRLDPPLTNLEATSTAGTDWTVTIDWNDRSY